MIFTSFVSFCLNKYCRWCCCKKLLFTLSDEIFSKLLLHSSPQRLAGQKKSNSYNHKTTIWVSHEYYLNPEFHKILSRAFWVIAILVFSLYAARKPNCCFMIIAVFFLLQPIADRNCENKESFAISISKNISKW